MTGGQGGEEEEEKRSVADRESHGRVSRGRMDEEDGLGGRMEMGTVRVSSEEERIEAGSCHQRPSRRKMVNQGPGMKSGRWKSPRT